MYVKVTVVAEARRERVAKIGEKEFEMTVKEPRRQNLANKRVREVLAEAHQKELNDVRLISGHRSRVKMFYIE